MENNDIVRRLRYTLDYNDAKMIALFELGNHPVDKTDLSNWLKKEDDPDYQDMSDKMLAVFLNGLIIDKRGKREGPPPVAENRLNNNQILKKVKIAFDLKTDDILDIFKLVGKHIGPHELSAFLRNPKQNQYRPCNDQYLRNFLSGLQKKYRG